MDRTVDPCKDFLSLHLRRLDQEESDSAGSGSRWDVYAKLTKTTSASCGAFSTERPKPAPARINVETEIGDYFRACMDESALEKAGAAPRKTRARPDRRAPNPSATLPDLAGPPAPRHHWRAYAVRLRLQPGLRRFLARDRLRQRGRPGLARSRLLHQDRRQIGGDTQKYVEHVQQMFELLGEHARTQPGKPMPPL